MTREELWARCAEHTARLVREVRGAGYRCMHTTLRDDNNLYVVTVTAVGLSGLRGCPGASEETGEVESEAGQGEDAAA